MAIRSEVAASIAATQALTQQALSGSASVQSAQVALYQASEAARGTVAGFMHDYYDRRIFDPYLKFTSAKDEEEYHRREEERQQAIEKALSENTPQGNLRADQLAVEQLKDAGAHGADRSPDYKPMLDNLETHKQELERRIAQQPAAPAEERSPKPLAASDAASALRAAGVSLADASDTPCVAPAKCTTLQVGRA